METRWERYNDTPQTLGQNATEVIVVMTVTMAGLWRHHHHTFTHPHTLAHTYTHTTHHTHMCTTPVQQPFAYS
eukprot:9825203-Lingulodinium_polyedra.AAC.1